MGSDFLLLLLADALLVTHVLFVSFVVIGLVMILAVTIENWSWVRNPWFRLAHLAAIGIVTVQSWFGVICPLTTWEMALRARAGDTTYPGSFIAHWLETILYYEAPAWVFAICYTVFATVVVISWVWVRPRRFTNP